MSTVVSVKYHFPKEPLILIIKNTYTLTTKRKKKIKRILTLRLYNYTKDMFNRGDVFVFIMMVGK